MAASCRRIAVLALLLPAAVHAGSISGTCVEPPARAPLAAVDVAVRSLADSTLVAHATTGDDGRFRCVGLAPGHYRLRALMLGHAPLVRPDVELTAAAPDVELGALELAVAAVEVGGVATTTARSTAIVAPDRNIYLVKDLPGATTGSATDVLRNVPELDVDVNGNVSLRGSSGVKIQLNGRAAPMQGDALAAWLRNLPAGRIEKIEVVGNPSAKFDPEGTAGIVNIVLKGDADLGFSGSTNLSAGNRSRGSDLHLGWQRGRVTLYGGGSGYWSDGESHSDAARHNLVAPLAEWYRTSTASEFRSAYGMYDGSLDFTLDKRSTLYATVQGYGSASRSSTLAGDALQDSAGTDVSRHDRTDQSRRDGLSQFATLGVQHIVEKGRNEWSLEAGESVSHDGGEGDGLQRVAVPAGTADRSSLRGGANGQAQRSLQADVTRPAGAKGKLELGWRGSDRTNASSDALRWFAGGAPLATALNTASDYAHREVFQSGYVTASTTSGRLSVQLGARGELAHTTFDVRSSGHRYVHDYRSVYPSANAAWDFGAGRVVRATYSRRVDRPPAWYLNPEFPSADSLDRTVGNPALGPQYTHSVSVDASWSGSRGSLRLTPYWRRTGDKWDRVTRVDTSGVAVSTFENAASLRFYGASFTASMRQVKRLGGTLGASLYREHHEAGNLAAGSRRDATGWSVNGNVTFKTTARLDLQASVRYSPAVTLAQGRTVAAWFTSASARWKIDDHTGLSLWINDPFAAYRYGSTTHDVTYEQSTSYRYASRNVTLGFSRSWGKPPEQKARKQKGDAPGQDAAPTQP